MSLYFENWEDKRHFIYIFQLMMWRIFSFLILVITFFFSSHLFRVCLIGMFLVFIKGGNLLTFLIDHVAEKNVDPSFVISIFQFSLKYLFHSKIFTLHNTTFLIIGTNIPVFLKRKLTNKYQKILNFSNSRKLLLE